ncbi:MAG: hypothetical protein RMN51_01010 [Verrucomicrobiota bacterium]|nr:hypothetical protein [Limisphaera sp.]MDW8380678.1 hypothetical protein [Verrucomicrobiota bacterium]
MGLIRPVGGALRCVPRLRRWIVHALRWAVLAGFVPWGKADEQGLLVLMDFRREELARQWSAWNDLAPLQRSSDGLELLITGPDPYCGGPALQLPRRMPVWLELRLWSEKGGVAQVFYFQDQAREEDSIRFPVPSRQWHEVQLALGPLPPDVRFRFDPPGQQGRCIVAWLRLRERPVPTAPAWLKPTLPRLMRPRREVLDGAVRLIHGGAGWGDFEVRVENQRMAAGYPAARLAYQAPQGIRWLRMDEADRCLVEAFRIPRGGATQRIRAAGNETGLRVQAEWTDPEGGHWTSEQWFAPTVLNAVRVGVRVVCDQDRDVWHLPLLWLVAGLGGFGLEKQQAMFAGLEYLENEPSSSTADLVPPGSNRQVPDALKLTWPFMALVAQDRYLGVVWEQVSHEIAAVFDSPDRFFLSDGHLMGWIYPGSDGRIRNEASLLPHIPVRVKRGQPLEWRGWLIGGRGRTVVPAIQHAFRITGWPTPPDPGMTAQDYYRLAARGWLDSRIRAGDLYRHAVWPGFDPQPAADAAWTMLWLAQHVQDSALSVRLVEAAQAAAANIPTNELNWHQVGHVRRPLPALLFGGVLPNVQTTAQRAYRLLTEFRPDGSIHYEPRPGRPDFARTHPSREASGYTAERVCQLLEAALWCGDPRLIGAALDKLCAMDARFREGVPRGAQTWEIPLHTPDLLAAAHLVRAYVLAYELSGEQAWLERARYWAWAGVPFVYLHPPVPAPVGLYATIPVFGATSGQEPVWLGRPVQWCGLVYAEALWELAGHDSDGPWARLARGISFSGVQQTWRADDPDRAGLLPDYFLLREQRREGPAINPATVLLPAMRAYEACPPYQRAVLRKAGLRVHVPGCLEILAEQRDCVSFRVRPWWHQPCWMLVNGCRRIPSARINGLVFSPQRLRDYQEVGGCLVLPLHGPAVVELRNFGTP